MASLSQRALPLLACLLAMSCSRPELQLRCSRSVLLANGYDTALLRLYGAKDESPLSTSVGGQNVVRLSAWHFQGDHWESQLRAGILPGPVHLRVSANSRQVEETFQLTADVRDSAQDGTPDFLRLQDDSDQKAFRRRFTYLAESQYFPPAAARPREISDCSALVRYAYFGALRGDSALQKYSYPHTPLGPRILRLREGPYSPLDIVNGAFGEFADAHTLERFNSFLVSRDIRRALPGDLLFYRRRVQHGVVYHSMVVVGPSAVRPDGKAYLVYHTGPDGASQGEIRRLTMEQLLQFPSPEWRPLSANPLFLGVYRWNILKTTA